MCIPCYITSMIEYSTNSVDFVISSVRFKKLAAKIIDIRSQDCVFKRYKIRIRRLAF